MSHTPWDRRNPLATGLGLRLALLGGVLAVITGCSSSGNGPVRPPQVDPEAAADRALEQYDKDSDGALSAKELEACPGILVALKQFDANNDEKVDREELVQQLETLYADDVGMMSLACTVRNGRRAVPDAAVRFFPEEFLGDAVKAAGGWTDREGSARIAVPDKFLPEDQQGLQMMQPGIYRVEIETSTGEKVKSRQPMGFFTDITARETPDPVFNIR